jgi:uncharacterized protein (DUF2141 family)
MPPRIVLAACFAGLLSTACEAADLTITVDHLRNNTGQVLLCVFSAESSDAAVFPDCVKGRPVRSAKAPIAGGKVVMTFNGLKDGVYAIAVIHDENANGQLDTNFIGIPTEGIGVSNNPRLLGKPSFAEAKFTLKGNIPITIETKYIL